MSFSGERAHVEQIGFWCGTVRPIISQLVFIGWRKFEQSFFSTKSLLLPHPLPGITNRTDNVQSHYSWSTIPFTFVILEGYDIAGKLGPTDCSGVCDETLTHCIGSVCGRICRVRFRLHTLTTTVIMNHNYTCVLPVFHHLVFF